MSRRPLEEMTREELLQAVLDYENAITWQTSCTNCARLMDKNYEQYVEISKLVQLARRSTPGRGDVRSGVT